MAPLGSGNNYGRVCFSLLITGGEAMTVDAHTVRQHQMDLFLFPVEKVSCVTLLESSVSCDATSVGELIPLKNMIQLHT